MPAACLQCQSVTVQLGSQNSKLTHIRPQSTSCLQAPSYRLAPSGLDLPQGWQPILRIQVWSSSGNIAPLPSLVTGLASRSFRAGARGRSDSSLVVVNQQLSGQLEHLLCIKSLNQVKPCRCLSNYLLFMSLHLAFRQKQLIYIYMQTN